MTELELSRVDLDALAGPLEDQSYDMSWWIDADTGEIWPWGLDGQDERDDPDGRPGAHPIEPVSSQQAYGDMEDFVDTVDDARAADLLARAMVGRGAFRRFRDTVDEFPDLGPRWRSFEQVRRRRRAVGWRVGCGLVGVSAGVGCDA